MKSTGYIINRLRELTDPEVSEDRKQDIRQALMRSTDDTCLRRELNDGPTEYLEAVAEMADHLIEEFQELCAMGPRMGSDEQRMWALRTALVRAVDPIVLHTEYKGLLNEEYKRFERSAAVLRNTELRLIRMAEAVMEARRG